MHNQNIDNLLENQSLKNEFVIRNLDLSQVFFSIQDDLERENMCLRDLLEWADKYIECGDRKKMEADGYLFPPIHPGISPDDDWYRFERWMKGLPVRMKLKDRFPSDYNPIKPEDLNDEKLMPELQKLIDHLDKLGMGLSFVNDVPPRLVYWHLYEILEEEFELLTEGGWHLDGCSGYCPGCFQRPWCESGTSCCWSEDEKAGEMVLIDSVKEFVSASPVSLSVLQKCQAEEDKEFEEFEQRLKDTAPDDGDELPF